MPIASELEVTQLLATDSLALRDVQCRGECRHRSVQECASKTHLVFPYRGVYLRYVGGEQAVADANHVLFFNAHEGYQVSHPLAGGDASLSLTVSQDVLTELASPELLQGRTGNGFRQQHLGIDPNAQALVSVLRHTLVNRTAEPLQAESMALALACRALGPRTAKSRGASRSRRKLADRVKLLLASDLSRRWSLGEIAREIGGSPVYLTQLFQLTEGMPLYRYHLRLRLARALDLIGGCEDLSGLAAELGFSSHSHFSAAFRQVYGRSPNSFRRAAGPRVSR